MDLDKNHIYLRKTIKILSKIEADAGNKSDYLVINKVDVTKYLLGSFYVPGNWRDKYKQM